MKKWIHASRILAAGLAVSMLLPVSALAYDRQEAATIGGGTEVTVYAGTQNSNSTGNYLEDPGDYMAYNRYETPGYETSESNITSSTNFTATSAGGTVRITNGGVSGVSWDNSSNTLTLNGASGTVITIEGPEIDPYAVNTYNDKLDPLVKENLQNLTYYKQFDLFKFTGQEAGAPHTKDNATVQDVVYIKVEGENYFNNIAISGNVKVVFTGSGTLTLDASQTWSYDDYNDPSFDHLSDPSTEALASFPTVGYQGSLSGMVEKDVMSNERMTETVTEWYEYALPEIVIGEGMRISEGGSVYNTAPVDSDAEYQAWASYVGTESGPANKVVITAGASFTDVQDSSLYFYDAAYWACGLGITQGTGASLFSPYNSCTRSQFVTFLYRLAGEPDVSGLTADFTDLDRDQFYYSAALWAYENGITTGKSASTFAPDDIISRGEAAVLLYRYAASVSGSQPDVTITALPFTDLSSDQYYYNAVLWAYENGIIIGTTATTFEPGAACDRGTVVTLLYRVAHTEMTPDTPADGAIEGVTAIGFVDVDGVKLAAIAVEYSSAIEAGSISLADYEITDYGIVNDPACEIGQDPGVATAIYVNDAAEISEDRGVESGKYVIIEVNTDYQLGSIVSSITSAMAVSVKQVNAITSGGTVIPPSEEVVNYTVVESVNNRTGETVYTNVAIEGSWTLDDIAGYDIYGNYVETAQNAGEAFVATNCYDYVSGEIAEEVELPYAIYVPEDYDARQEYALVLYVTNSTGTGDIRDVLVSGQHASNFASESIQQLVRDQQGLAGAIVVVPYAAEKTNTDNYVGSKYVAATWQLMDFITENYSISMNNIYASGHSMGGNQIMAMLSQRDDYFAAVWGIGAQWGNNYEMEREFVNTLGGGSVTTYHTPSLEEEPTITNEDWQNWYYAISNQNILITSPIDDEKTGSVWTEATYIYSDLVGVEIPHLTGIDPLSDKAEQSAAIEEFLEEAGEEFGIYWVSFSQGTHQQAWLYSLGLESCYEWLFSKSLDDAQSRDKLDLNKQFEYAEVQEARAHFKYPDELPAYYVTGAAGSGTLNYNSGWFPYVSYPGPVLNPDYDTVFPCIVGASALTK